jgi:hypothetical protein
MSGEGLIEFSGRNKIFLGVSFSFTNRIPCELLVVKALQQ